MRKIYLENRGINQKNGKQHSKFYRMIQINSVEFEAVWGAIGRPIGKKVYNMSQWWILLGKKRDIKKLQKM